jgi:hypothetical protein
MYERFMSLWDRTTLRRTSGDTRVFVLKIACDHDSLDPSPAPLLTSGCRSSPSGCEHAPSHHKQQRRWPCSRCQRKRCTAGGLARSGRQPWRTRQQQFVRKESRTSAHIGKPDTHRQARYTGQHGVGGVHERAGTGEASLKSIGHQQASASPMHAALPPHTTHVRPRHIAPPSQPSWALTVVFSAAVKLATNFMGRGTVFLAADHRTFCRIGRVRAAVFRRKSG